MFVRIRLFLFIAIIVLLTAPIHGHLCYDGLGEDAYNYLVLLLILFHVG